jgi:predicted metalloprotease with PDZ domain
MHFDGQVVRQDADIARLAGQFVCVRVQSMNGINLTLFPFEYDLTWMAFFMDGQDRFYARYGGRNDRAAESHLNKESLVRVMTQVLELHRAGKVQTSRYEPAPAPARTPEEIPTMRALLARRQEKCIHCHDVKVAELRHLQAQGRFDRDLIFTYPVPEAVGIEVDPQAQNAVARVSPGSAADRAGVRRGDVLLSADGQRLLTLGDFARVLELTPKEGRLPLELRRDAEVVRTTLQLSGDWRRSQDPSWRESLHVGGPGAGFWGMKLKEDERKRLGLAADGLAVRVTAIYGAHAKQAGVRNGDVVLEIDGLRKDWTIRQLHAHLHLNRNFGEAITLIVQRGGKEQKLLMQLPVGPPELE